MRSNVKDGSVNETMIRVALDKHYYKDLDELWKRHMKRMFKSIKDDDYIYCNYYEYKDAKPDLVITVNNRKILLSVKSGHSPTMHDEPVKTFYDFLREMNVPERMIRIISFYHYGYSLKPGMSHYPLSREEIIAKHSFYLNQVNDYFRSHQEIIRELIYRSIIRGRLKRDVIDYLFYGNSSKGFLLSVSDILKLISNDKNEGCKSICFNSLTYVVASREKGNEKRHHLKLHWPILSKWFYDDEFMKKYG